MVYSIPNAKANLARLISDACRGKEVLISGKDGCVVKLVAVVKQSKKRKPGRLKGKISYSPDAFAPLTSKERKDLGFD
jgi:antitoxin (DNA-binding transcriptional repressor) of toxin-antitoxin stability system